MAVLVMALAALPVAVSAPIAARNVQEAVRQQLEDRPGAMTVLSPEEQQQAIASASNPLVILVMPVLGRLASLWLSWLLWAGGLSILSAMAGGKTSFRQFWPVVIWAWLPFALRGLLQGAFVLATGEPIANPGLSGLVVVEQPVSNLFAAPPGPGVLALRSFLSQVDLFLAWNLFLLAAGVMVTARLSRRKAALITLGLWLVLTLLGLLPAVISGAMLPRL